MKPRLAILFWFYKDMDVCRNRLRLLRMSNPGVLVYGLYGGDVAQAATFEQGLRGLLDDFYTFAEPRDSLWKWYNGDLVIQQWFQDRGCQLAWDSIVVVQWDMLLFGDVRDLFGHVGMNEVLCSGQRPVAEIEALWSWTNGTSPKDRGEYEDFLRATGMDSQEALACLFVVVVLPRVFFERYAAVATQSRGFLEYRVVSYARRFGLGFASADRYFPWWGFPRDSRRLPRWKRVIRASKTAVPWPLVAINALFPCGVPIVHPVHRLVPLWLYGAALRLRGGLTRVLRLLGLHRAPQYAGR